jgi:hypothetical protein
MMGGMETHGKGSARFVTPIRARAVLRWTPDELAIVERSITIGLTLDQTHALIPYRSRDSVKDQFYKLRPLELREKLPRDKTDIMDDIHRQKDAVTGSARLLEALRAAGFVEAPLRKAS